MLGKNFIDPHSWQAGNCYFPSNVSYTYTQSNPNGICGVQNSRAEAFFGVLLFSHQYHPTNCPYSYTSFTNWQRRFKWNRSFHIQYTVMDDIFFYIVALRPNAGRGLLWTSDQLVAETSTWQHTQQTNIHAPGGILTHDLSRQAAADQRLRPRGYCDRPYVRYIAIQITGPMYDI